MRRPAPPDEEIIQGGEYAQFVHSPGDAAPAEDERRLAFHGNKDRGSPPPVQAGNALCYRISSARRRKIPGKGSRELTRRILLLLAHPDDETFGPGGTIAKYSSEGAGVYLATATTGQAGMIGDPPVTDREHLGEVRAAALRCAARVLGIRDVAFLGFADGRLAQTPRALLVEKAVDQIRRFRPHVLIGFGPGGVSGHPDHVVMSEVALEAFDAAADPMRFPRRQPEGLAPWAPCKLYQFEIAQEILDAWNAPLAGVPRESLSAFVDVSAFVERKVEAFSCHRTQAKDSARILSREGYREFARLETYVLAKTRLPRPGRPENGLLEDIPDEETPEP
ncbi:MAG: PIG-L family deacetylase [Deltaproteobacteria bacterium]|nr:PIG-L family deacetylase [Deltaproteobacteria bacterium]